MHMSKTGPKALSFLLFHEHQPGLILILDMLLFSSSILIIIREFVVIWKNVGGILTVQS